MPPAAEPTRRPIPRPFLERVSRALLARLLARHEAAFAVRREVSLAALAASAQTDRAEVEAVWRLLGAPPAELVLLHEELLAIADVATPGGHEVLLARDAAGALDRELGAEDCAAVAFLDHRALFDMARPQSGPAQTKSFATFQPREPRPLPHDASHAAAFAQKMSDELEARGRTRYFKTHEWRSGAERHVEIVYGRLASTRDLITKTVAPVAGSGVAHDVTAQVTDRTSERAHAVFHDDTARLDVAGPEWVKEIVRRAFGEAYFGSAQYFQGDETLTLAPLADLASALAVDDVPGLKKAELQEVWIDLADGTGWIAIGARGECTNGGAGGYVTRALDEGAPTQATFLLYTHAKARPVKLTLVAPRKMEFDRRDARVVRAVRDWVVARGFMSVPQRAGAVASANDDASRSPAVASGAEDA